MKTFVPRSIACAASLYAACAVAQVSAGDAAAQAAKAAVQAVEEAVAAADPQACIPPSTFVELQSDVAGTVKDSEGKELVALGMYERISPDGRYVMRSLSGRKLGEVSLLELPAFEGTVLAGYPTPLANEAFPVQGTWRYLVSINGQHYRFADVLKQGVQAKPLFKGGMTGFYAVASELPGSKPGEIRIRSMSWPNNTGGDGDNQGVGALAATTLTVDTTTHRITHNTGTQYLCRDRASEDGTMYALPMISVDGMEYSALPQMPIKGKPTMRIFGFGKTDNGCQVHEAFDNSSGKTIFGFAKPDGSGADMAYTYKSQVWWYSRALRQGFNIAPPMSRVGDELLASSFPGITRDGRIIYASTLRHCNEKGLACTQQVGYTIADPYQSAAFKNFRAENPGVASKFPACITRGEVMKEREAFAKMHGL